MHYVEDCLIFYDNIMYDKCHGACTRGACMIADSPSLSHFSKDLLKTVVTMYTISNIITIVFRLTLVAVLVLWHGEEMKSAVKRE